MARLGPRLRLAAAVVTVVASLLVGLVPAGSTGLAQVNEGAPGEIRIRFREEECRADFRFREDGTDVRLLEEIRCGGLRIRVEIRTGD